MTVKQLKELIKDAPDDLTVMCFGENAEGFEPDTDTSGVVEFGDPCDEFGNSIEDGLGNIKMLALFDPSGVQTI